MILSHHWESRISSSHNNLTNWKKKHNDNRKTQHANWKRTYRKREWWWSRDYFNGKITNQKERKRLEKILEAVETCLFLFTSVSSFFSQLASDWLLSIPHHTHTVMTRQSWAFPTNMKILVVSIAQDLKFMIVSPDCFQSQIWRQILSWHPQDILIGQSKTLDNLAFAMLGQEGGKLEQKQLD